MKPYQPNTTDKNRWRATARLSLRLVLVYLLLVIGIVQLHPYLTDWKQQSLHNTPSAASQVAEKKAADRLAERAKNGWSYTFTEMNDGPLSDDDWNFEEGTEVANYNNEAQAYTGRLNNVRIEDGLLLIQAHRESMYGKDYTSARINTLGKFEFTHGTLEVDMMLPQGVGTWPAAWLMPSNNRYDPADHGISPNDPHNWVLNGEIDFMEAIGSIPGENIPAAHTYNQMKRSTLYTPGQVSTPYTEFHRYGIIKTANKIEFTIDGVPFASREKTGDSALDWPFEQPYYLILNLALGGSWAGADGIDDSMAPWTMKIRSITYTPPSTPTE